MGRVLVLGGTAWLGHEIARAAVAAGHDVVCLARGRSGAVPAGAQLVASDRSESDAYARLDGDWDAVVELSSEPEFVASALESLADRARHWTLISSVSVYRSNDEPGADESAPLVAASDPSDYAQAKVLAERASAARIGDRLLIARPGLIVGPGDPSDRFGYWPARMHRGGRVLAPEFGGRFGQVIDASDLAEWVVRAGQVGTIGTMNAVGASHPLEDVIALAGEIAGFAGTMVHADDAWLLAHDARYWAGPRSLPLWLPLEDAAFAQRSNAAYLAAGGEVRPMRDTMIRVLEDELARGVDRVRRSGLSAEEEATLLGLLR